MDPSRRARMMARQLEKGWKDCVEFLIPVVEDLEKWHFLIFGLPAPFDGEYLLEMRPSSNFPKSPPSFNFLTPNGLYGVNESICLSNGAYHANDRPGETGSHGWRASEGMFGAAKEIVNGMLCPEALVGGMGLYVSTPREVREAHARDSVGFNREHFPEVCAGVEEWAAANGQHPAVRQLRETRNRRRIRDPASREAALALMLGGVYLGGGHELAAAEILADPLWEKHVGLLGKLDEAPRRRAVGIVLAASGKGDCGPAFDDGEDQHVEGYVKGAGALIRAAGRQEPPAAPLDAGVAAAILTAIAEEDDIDRRKALTAAAEEAVARAD